MLEAFPLSQPMFQNCSTELHGFTCVYMGLLEIIIRDLNLNKMLS